MEPLLKSSRPEIIFKKVVLPEPEGPTRLYDLFDSNVKFISSKTLWISLPSP